ncbi:MAG: rRNA maturation RNase YbeY [Candidatus Pacebacteria bacterium]|nr:rRNA maturation RNase YbeY [Candidatus Paceibacterota bacterium]
MAKSDNSVAVLFSDKVGKCKDLPFSDLKHDILGEHYEISIAFVSSRISRKLNRECRGRDNPTNILSFPLDKKSGEIVLCMDVIEKEYKNWQKSLYEFTGFLVIHGMLHLKGMEHGAIMDKQEQKFYAKYFHRDKPRIVDRTRSSRRVHKR